MTTRVDLSQVALIDNHCHAPLREPFTTTGQYRSLFSESHHESMSTGDAAHTAFYARLINRLADWYGVAANEAAVLEARANVEEVDNAARLLRDANISHLILDDGYPRPHEAIDIDGLATSSGVTMTSLLRLETAFQELVVHHATLASLIEAVRELVADGRAKGFVGFKSIVGYRTGLDIQTWDHHDVEHAFTAAREEVATHGAVRLGFKPLLDTLLHLALAAAAAQELPVQFHVAYGDHDADFRSASPLELRAVLENDAYRSAPIVLLHGCWPYFREGAYLASVYQNAYLDISYGIPFLSTSEMYAMTSAAFAVVPFTKVMYSSDGARVAELHWLSARDGRRAAERTLDALVESGDLTIDQAQRAGQRFGRDNALALYGLEPTNG
jgi:uncharacterized protein